jgi:hypothetical protein
MPSANVKLISLRNHNPCSFAHMEKSYKTVNEERNILHIAKGRKANSVGTSF